MAGSPALGNAPINFVDSNGKQYSMPLSFISFGAAGTAPDLTSWPGWSATPGEQSAITQWVSTLAAQNLVAPLSVPAPALLFTLTAASPGVAGNDIHVTFNALNADGSLNVTVSTTQVYENLTVSSVETQLGLTASGGASPGLAYVSAPFTTVPADLAETAFTALPGPNYELAVPGSGGGVLTASYLPASLDAGHITASIAAADPVFTLTLKWTNTVSSVTPATLQAAFSYLITVTPPSGGFGAATPAIPSTVVLVGGAGPSSTAAVAASAPVLST